MLLYHYKNDEKKKDEEVKGKIIATTTLVI